MWEEFVEIAHCYMLPSMTKTLYKQLESYKTAKVILDKLEDMFRGQSMLAQQSIITSLMNAQQKARHSGQRPYDHSYGLLCQSRRQRDQFGPKHPNRDGATMLFQGFYWLTSCL
ncbi:hypothetical protein PVK06_043325 [Gossypium arboreum]|uniref:Uncharacterized protein n=1 Tax=Gossypium arboreum TaxID=29729 RepID=A0ABR0MNL9_GOSAR|nr:hypothetical protein PVK06_043325 [Gossypium arboreum]